VILRELLQRLALQPVHARIANMEKMRVRAPFSTSPLNVQT
jgi:hypothetical protein